MVKKEKEWETATCPICGKEYQYIKGEHKPQTCGKFTCLQKLFAGKS